MEPYKFYKLSKEEVLKHFHTNPKLGLSEREAKKRIGQYGPNKLKQVALDSWLKVF
jgi:Cation transport ATPase